MNEQEWASMFKLKEREANKAEDEVRRNIKANVWGERMFRKRRPPPSHREARNF